MTRISGWTDWEKDNDLAKRLGGRSPLYKTESDGTTSSKPGRVDLALFAHSPVDSAKSQLKVVVEAKADSESATLNSAREQLTGYCDLLTEAGHGPLVGVIVCGTEKDLMKIEVYKYEKGKAAVKQTCKLTGNQRRARWRQQSLCLRKNIAGLSCHLPCVVSSAEYGVRPIRRNSATDINWVPTPEHVEKILTAKEVRARIQTALSDLLCCAFCCSYLGVAHVRARPSALVVAYLMLIAACATNATESAGQGSARGPHPTKDHRAGAA